MTPDQRLIDAFKSIRVALVHDWLTGMRGGEKCLECFCEIFPRADIYTLLHVPGSVSETIERHPIRSTWIRRLPLAATAYRNYLPLFPLALKSLKLKDYDLVLSSSHCVAKGVRVPENALHIAYIHTPMRYVWDMYEAYFGKNSPASRPAKWVMPFLAPRLRHWDVHSNSQVHFFLANSRHVQRRIQHVYDREAEVVFPPVDLKQFDLFPRIKDYYLMVTALAPYKRVDLAIEAFKQMGKPLLIVGSGPLRSALQKSSGENIRWLGWQENIALRQLYGECRALIFPGEEDAGITPLEAQASGRPVVAFGRGGALETVIDLKEFQEGRCDFFSGIFFSDQTVPSLIEAVERLEAQAHLLNPNKIRAHALEYDREVFKEKIRRAVWEKWRAFRSLGL